MHLQSKVSPLISSSISRSFRRIPQEDLSGPASKQSTRVSLHRVDVRGGWLHRDRCVRQGQPRSGSRMLFLESHAALVAETTRSESSSRCARKLHKRCAARRGPEPRSQRDVVGVPRISIYIHIDRAQETQKRRSREEKTPIRDPKTGRLGCFGCFGSRIGVCHERKDNDDDKRK